MKRISPFKWTRENWESFLGFCERYGYVISDKNWQQWKGGNLGKASIGED